MNHALFTEISKKHLQKFQNNFYSLMNHLDIYNQLLEQGRDSKTNDYLLFYNKLEDS